MDREPQRMETQPELEEEVAGPGGSHTIALLSEGVDGGQVAAREGAAEQADEHGGSESPSERCYALQCRLEPVLKAQPAPPFGIENRVRSLSAA